MKTGRKSLGYDCWVRRGGEILKWWIATRKQAIQEVKEAVRRKETEGGVDSLDSKKPFEVVYAMVDGKLITTKHT